VPVSGRPRNPLGQGGSRFHGRRRVFVERPGASPGLMDIDDTRVDTAAAGTIRRLWLQAVNMVPAPPPFPVAQAPLGITRALRYRASSLFQRAGNDNTRFGAARPYVPARHHQRPVTIAAGNQQGRPTVRNRMTSFGSRVAPVNPPSPAAETRKPSS
jgi:hypothetical protein